MLVVRSCCRGKLAARPYSCGPSGPGPETRGPTDGARPIARGPWPRNPASTLFACTKSNLTKKSYAFIDGFMHHSSRTLSAEMTMWLGVIVAAWFFASAHWLLGRHFIPWDSVDAFFPQTSFVVGAIGRGEAPWWNPLAFGGMPVLGDPQGLIFVPHTVTGLLSGRHFGLWIFDITTLACVLAGGLGFFFYLRQHGAITPLAALGAIVFMLSGVATSRLQHVPQIVSYGLLPLLLLSFRMAAQSPGAASAALLGLVGLLLTLNPNHVVFLTPFLLAPILLFEFAKSTRKFSTFIVAVSASFIILAGSAFTATAVIETVGFSTRSALTLQNSLATSLPGFTLWSLALPNLFAGIGEGQAYWGPADRTQSYLYIGIIPLFMIFLALVRRERPPLLFGIAVAGIALSFAFSMGLHGPLFPWLFENVPGFSAFRRPSDGAYFVSFYAALAVGLAMAPGSAYVRSWAERTFALVICVLPFAWTMPGLLEQAALRGGTMSLQITAFKFLKFLVVSSGILGGIYLLRFLPLRSRIAATGLAACALTALDLGNAGRSTHFSAPYEASPSAQLFRRLSRWEAWQNTAEDTLRLLAQGGGRQGRSEFVGGDLAGAGPMALGFPLSQGYNPVNLRPFATVFGTQHLGVEPKRFSEAAPSYTSEAYRWLGLRFVLLHSHTLHHALQFGELGRAVLRLREALPHQGAERLEGDGAYEVWRLPAPHSRGSMVALHGGDDSPPSGRCDISQETTTRLRYLCETATPARLVVPDSFAPGWLACVNGVPTPVMPFMGAMRAVAVPDGRSEITLRYVPVPFMRPWSKCLSP